MARDLNKVQITGNLGADPEMRYTASGSAVTTFRVASGRQWKDGQGNPRDDTEWFRCVAWEKLGEICNQYLTKGTRVYVEGRLQTRKWTDQSGQERYTTEIVASDMIILSSRNDRGGAPDEVPDFHAPEELPAAAPAHRVTAANGNGGSRSPASALPRPSSRNQPQPVDNDDDIPF